MTSDMASLIKASYKLIKAGLVDSEPTKKPIKIGVKQGDGPPLGYQWNVDVLDSAFKEAMNFVDEAQYHHLADQVRELARQSDPTHSDIVDVRPIEEFFEIRDKGGILGKINVRVFYFVDKPARKIVVIGAIKKENEGQTEPDVRIRMRRRMRSCQSKK
jgi:hypothetical protein